MLLDVTWAVVTEGMDMEQRAEFEKQLNDPTTGSDRSLNDRRAYALTHGEMG